MRLKAFLLALLMATVSSMLLAGTNISVTTNDIQLVMQVRDNGRLYQTYLGGRLSPTVNLDDLSMPLGESHSTLTRGNEVYPVMGTEDYYAAPFEIRHSDGNPTSVLKYVSHETKAVDGGTETVVRLRDEVYPVSVILHVVAYPEENIIKQYAEISHQEKGKVFLSRYASSMLYFEAPHYYLTEFSSNWAKEMMMSSQQLQFGKKTIDTRLGSRENFFAPPFFEVGIGSPVSEDAGLVLMGTLAWTGNFRFTFEIDNNNELRVLSGINPDASTYLLPRGEVFRTPEFIFTLSQNGTGQGSRNFQRWALRHQVHNAQKNRLTLLNNWENTYFNFNEAKLTSLLDEAKDLGVDLFLLDDGWFGNKYPRQDDHTSLGDWQENREKLPRGVPYLVEAAADRGLGFGIWIEPEMVSPKSELAEKHPDWILRLPDRETYYMRNQLVLDLSNPAVQDYVFSVVDGLMRESPAIKYIKWDCNSPITNTFSYYEKDRQGNLYVDYARGLYRVLERVQYKYPDLYMMMCSGGGGRCDFAGLKYFTEFWCSDNTDPVERLFIQWGFSQFMPSKVMCAHVTDWNRRASVKFRTDVAFPFKLGFDIDFDTLSPADKEYCRQAIREHCRLQEVIYSPLLYRLVSPYDSNHCAMQRTSEDGAKTLVYAYDIHPRFAEQLLPVRLKGLNADARYLVREIMLQPGQTSSINCDNKVYSGDYLMKIGLKLFTGNDLSSRIVEITKQ